MTPEYDVMFFGKVCKACIIKHYEKRVIIIIIIIIIVLVVVVVVVVLGDLCC